MTITWCDRSAKYSYNDNHYNMLSCFSHSCLTLCDAMDCSLPGSSIHGILQVRILEWIAISSSRGSSRPRDWSFISYIYLHWQVGSLPLASPGKNITIYECTKLTYFHVKCKQYYISNTLQQRLGKGWIYFPGLWLYSVPYN